MIYFCSSLSRDERIWPHSLGTTRFFYKKKKKYYSSRSQAALPLSGFILKGYDGVSGLV